MFSTTTAVILLQTGNKTLAQPMWWIFRVLTILAIVVNQYDSKITYEYFYKLVTSFCILTPSLCLQIDSLLSSESSLFTKIYYFLAECRENHNTYFDIMCGVYQPKEL